MASSPESASTWNSWLALPPMAPVSACTARKVSPQQCVKTLLVRGRDGLVALCLRGDHEINAVKAGKLAELPDESVLASEEEILAATGTRPGFIGPVGLPATIPVIVDRDASKVSVPELYRTQVLETWVGGKKVWSRTVSASGAPERGK